MAEDEKLDKPISKRLKLLFIIPLILSVVICSAIVIVVVFITQQNWVSKTEKTLKEKQLLFMENYALTVKHTLESTLNMQYLHLNIISQLYIMQENNEIEASSSLQEPTFKNAYDLMLNQYPDTSLAEWVSGKTDSKGPDSEVYQIPDAFFRTYFNSTQIFKQAGYLTNYDDDMFYLYPVENMDFLNETFNYSATCGVNQSHYRPECTQAYAYLFGQKMFILIYYENSKLYIMQNFSDENFARASVMSLPVNTLTSKLMTDIGYTTFACNIYGKWTLAVSGSEIQDFVGPNREISYALYKNDSRARKDFVDNVLGSFTQSKGSGIADINSVNTFIAFAQMNLSIDSQEELNYTVGVSRTEQDVLKTWNDFDDDVLILMIIQACIYAGFLLLTIAIAWRLSMVIEHRVAKPIESISGYMKCGDPTLYMIQDSYNCQLNSILDNLRKIEDIEKLIDPNFLLNPVVEVRIKNLEVARTMFQSIDNKRGLAIVLNLLGNLNFSAKKNIEAEGLYTEALVVLEQLYEEIVAQEKSEIEREEQENGLFYEKKQNEKKLSEKKVLDENGLEGNNEDAVEETGKLEKIDPEEEKKKLLQAVRTVSDFWISKKKLILDLISEQILQICLALKTRLKDEPSSQFASSRAKWKELIKLKTRVLQHYINYKQSLADYLNLLLDIAEDFQILKFSHTCTGILELVEFSILTIKNDEKSKINVDSGRLRKFGINVLDSGFNQHFSVNPELFELDYLSQKLYLTSGKLYLDKEMYYKAAIMFQSAILYGTYFDPDIRLSCIKELFGLISRFNFDILAQDLKVIYNFYLKEKQNVLLVMAFDLAIEEELANVCINLTSNIINESMRFGAISKNNVDKVLEVIERDFPRLDLENLIIQTRGFNSSENLMDSIGRAADLINLVETSKDEVNVLIVFYKKSKEIQGLLNIDTLAAKLNENTKILFVNVGDTIGLDLEVFIENQEGEILKVDDLSRCEEQVRSLFEAFK